MTNPHKKYRISYINPANMQADRSYKKLPKSAKASIDNYALTKDKKILFLSIIENIATQSTFRAKQVRRATFRGLLRKYFNLSNDDMKPIESTPAEKQQYYDMLKIAEEKHHEEIITEALLKGIINTGPICELMIRSGLRITELLENNYKIEDGGNIIFSLNKKRGPDIKFSIHIIGNIQIFITKLKALRAEVKTKDPKYLIDKLNRKLKEVIPPTFYKQSSHICRAIYVAYLYRFKTTKQTIPQTISTYLNHDNLTASSYYQHVILSPDMTDFLQKQSLTIVRGYPSQKKEGFIKELTAEHPEHKFIQAGPTQNDRQKAQRHVKTALEYGISVIVSDTFTDLTRSAYSRIIKNTGVKLKIYRIDTDNPGRIPIIKYTKDSPYIRTYHKSPDVQYIDKAPIL